MALAVISHEGAGGGVIGAIALRTIAVALRRHGIGVAVVKCTERCGRNRAGGFRRAADHALRCANGAVVAIIAAAFVRPAIAPVTVGRLIALIVVGVLTVGVAIVALRPGPWRASHVLGQDRRAGRRQQDRESAEEI